MKPNKKPRIKYLRIVFWEIKRFFIDIAEAVEYFKARRYILRHPNSGALLMPEIKLFDRPDMYIGTISILKLIKKYKISMQTLDKLPFEDSKTACVGFSKKTMKWYGWSHRAIYGFKIGDVVTIGDLTNTPGYHEDFLKEHPEMDLSLEVGFKAKTFADCKRMAIAFAAAVN